MPCLFPKMYKVELRRRLKTTHKRRLLHFDAQEAWDEGYNGQSGEDTGEASTHY